MNTGEEYAIDADGNYGGDKIERYGWPVFGKSRFPYYEKFWRLFVVPKTNRPIDIHYKKGIEISQKEICSIHYSIYSHFYSIYDFIENHAIDRTTFDFCFMRLSNICDLVEEFLFKLSIDKKLIHEDHTLFTPNKNKVIQKCEAITNSKIFSDLGTRSSSSIIIKSRVDVLKKLYKLNDYIKIANPIRNYRNVIVHSWQTFQYNDMVPAFNKVKKYQDWQKITDKLKEKDPVKKEELIKADFVRMDKLLINTTEVLINEINMIWEQIIDTNKSNDVIDIQHDEVSRFSPGVSSGLHIDQQNYNIGLSANYRNDH